MSLQSPSFDAVLVRRAHPASRSAAPAAWPLARGLFPPSAAWLTIAAVVLLTAAVVVHGCGNSLSIPCQYAGYFILQDLVPGTILLYLIGCRPLSPSLIVALGIPTGYALEIFSFLGLSSVGARDAMPALPLAWLAVGAWRYAHERDFRGLRPAPGQLASAAALGAIGFVTVLAAASQMYAESPLVDGLPQRPIFHDWVYLLSRAAVIKQYWPLQDPSLAGTPLQYHYLFLVHVGAASANTQVAVTWILLRLAVIPLGFVLVAQAYALGKLLARSRLAGVISAALVVIPGELSSADDYGHLTFLGHFARWLYVSPTFFFGVIFLGALLLAVPLCRPRWPQLAWLALLAAAGTGAKGSVLPVILCATALWGAWTWLRRNGGGAGRIVVCGLTMGLAFVLAYGAMLAACGSGGALIRPFEICRLTPFWNDYAIPCQRLLKRSLHAPDFGTWLGAGIVAFGVIVGSSGMRVLAVPYLFRRDRHHRHAIARWLVTTAIVSIGAGLMLHFDGDSELYFFLPQRIPFAVLTAAFLVAVFKPRSNGERPAMLRTAGDRRWNPLAWRSVRYASIAAICGLTVLQCVNTARCQFNGLRDWLGFDRTVAINDDLMPLYETTTWIQRHTEPTAVLLSNAFTITNVPRGRGVTVDHTTAGVYYYYSALAERRVWVEGPSYLLDQAEAKHRLCEAEKFFYHHQRFAPMPLDDAPLYVVLDRALNDHANVSPTVGVKRVYRNSRFDVFRLDPLLSVSSSVAHAE